METAEQTACGNLQDPSNGTSAQSDCFPEQVREKEVELISFNLNHQNMVI